MFQSSLDILVSQVWSKNSFGKCVFWVWVHREPPLTTKGSAQYLDHLCVKFSSSPFTISLFLYIFSFFLYIFSFFLASLFPFFSFPSPFPFSSFPRSFKSFQGWATCPPRSPTPSYATAHISRTVKHNLLYNCKLARLTSCHNYFKGNRWRHQIKPYSIIFV